MMPKIEETLGVTPAGLRLIKLFIEVSFIAHFLSCGWYVLLRVLLRLLLRL
jgi:hypothetical protein